MRPALPLVLALAGIGGLSQVEGAIPRPRELPVERDPIVWVPEGEFRMGATHTDLFFAILLCQDEHDLAVAEGCAQQRFAHELGARRIRLEGFGIDRTEVTQAAWRRCVMAGVCAPPRLEDDDPLLAGDAMPVAGVTAAEAERYCAFAGGRLPTEAEWEKAARGDGTRRFPWGRGYHARLANHGRPPMRPDASDGWRYAAPVGSFPDGASPYGALDMSGNVAEWTASAPSAADFEALGHTGADPATYRIVRGGSWSHPAVELRVTHRGLVLATGAYPDLGLRCAYDQERR